MAKRTKVLKLTPEQEARRALIRRVGEVAFGSPAWKIPLGKAIGVSRVSLHYWVTGSRPAPPRIEGMLLNFLRQRRKDLRAREAELAALEREVERYVSRRD